MELIFIGNHFYSESSTEMSSLYDIHGNRQDWGGVESALSQGQSVHIRPATDSEMEYYQRKLDKIKKIILFQSIIYCF